MEIQIEDAPFIRDFVDLHIYEIRGECEQFYHGYVGLDTGQNSVTIPASKDLILDFVRAKTSWGYQHTNSDSLRLQNQTGKLFRYRLRERNGSREVIFTAKAPSQSGFQEYDSLPLPKCEKVKYLE